MTFFVPAILLAAIATSIGLGTKIILGSRGNLADRSIVEHEAGPVFHEDAPVISRTFTIPNNSGQAIRLVDKSCTCTCTTTALAGTTIGPGESTTLTMSVNTPPSYSGKTRVRCDLAFDDGSTRTCAIVYTSYPKILVENENLSLGRFGPGPSLPAAQTIHVDLFSPIGRALSRLKSIQAPKELTATLAGEPVTSVTSGVNRRRYTVKIGANARALQVPGEFHTRTVSFLAEDGSSTIMHRELEASGALFGHTKACPFRQGRRRQL